ncbi:MAG: NAD-dependent epimerase/dehydratase family protein [Candidatus Dormibacteraeota bacterium]|uniref:NAD-dependent epimerase/dehydratase family protein n=1 Tax=Candidatus Amunia macphersoniae TaxID=3127014 RepID=A0A934KRL2_9BACT|nr:NAD-dependent epimerase/dehydratase family protein [Candidatus Dormibacteraeota bacterium]
MSQGRRILVTGVSRFWGAELARRLEADPDVEQIVAIDSEGPGRPLARTDYVRADIRHSLVGKLVRGLGIDTVVHAGLIVDPQQAGARTVHETNVIGTMNLLAACSGPDSPVRRVVVKSSTAVYGSEPDDPSFWTEEMSRRSPARNGFTRDLDEVESYVREFDDRHPGIAVTTLRFGNVLGEVHDSPFARLFDLPAIPTVFGFDPRVQFLDEVDAVAALHHAARGQYQGTYNVAGPGVVVLSQAIALLGKINAPVIPFVGGAVAMRMLDRLGLVDFPAEFVRLLQYGRVVDTSRLHKELGFVPTRSTIETVLEYGRRRRVRGLVDDATPYRYEHELEDFLRSRGRRQPDHDRAAADPSAARSAPRRRRRATPRVTVPAAPASGVRRRGAARGPERDRGPHP